MPLQSHEIARREGNTVELRAQPMRLRWKLDDLVCSDGHALMLQLTCAVRALGEPAEKKMLEEAFLASGPIATDEHVVQYFQQTLRSAAAAACLKKPAAQWLAEGPGELIETLKTAGKRAAFACGLEFIPPFELEIHSPTVEQQRLEAMQRELARQRAAGQLEHFQRATELLGHFESIRQSMPHLSPGELLSQISPSDQGPLLQTLLLAAGRQGATAAVWAVAGSSLLKIDPRANPPRCQAATLPADLGPCRSVQPAGDRLLVGMRSGVLLVNPADPADAQAYADSSIVSSLGFNRAVLWNDQVWACHGEAGVVGWTRDSGLRPVFVLRPVNLLGAAPRNLQVLDENRLIFSTNDRLMVLSVAKDQAGPVVHVRPIQPDAGQEIIAVLPEKRRVTVVLKNGLVQSRDPRTLEVTRQEQRSGQVLAATLMPWLGSSRLLLATEDGPVFCVGWDDDLVTQYQSRLGGMRALAAAPDVICGLSADRQRIVIWNTWNARQPLADVFVTAIARHRAADVDVA